MDGKSELTPELVEEFVLAAHSNFPKVREMLEQEPRLLNEKWTRFDENGLEASGHMGREDIANYLLDNGAPLTIFAAAMLGRADDVAAFIEKDSALASANGVHGFPILYHAALSASIDIAELLVANGGGQGASVSLHGAVGKGHGDMVMWLLGHGADPNARNFNGKTTLDVALAQGNTVIADALREHGGTESAPEEAQAS